MASLNLEKLNERALLDISKVLVMHEAPDNMLEVVANETSKRYKKRQAAKYREQRRKEKRLMQGGEWQEKAL